MLQRRKRNILWSTPLEHGDSKAWLRWLGGWLSSLVHRREQRRCTSVDRKRRWRKVPRGGIRRRTGRREKRRRKKCGYLRYFFNVFNKQFNSSATLSSRLSSWSWRCCSVRRGGCTLIQRPGILLAVGVCVYPKFFDSVVPHHSWQRNFSCCSSAIFHNLLIHYSCSLV